MSVTAQKKTKSTKALNLTGQNSAMKIHETAKKKFRLFSPRPLDLNKWWAVKVDVEGNNKENARRPKTTQKELLSNREKKTQFAQPVDCLTESRRIKNGRV